MTLRAILWRLLLIKTGVARRRYRRCLARITRLERALWPPATLTQSGEFVLEPGARWIVDNPANVQFLHSQNFAQVLKSSYGMKVALEREKFYGASS